MMKHLITDLVDIQIGLQFRSHTGLHEAGSHRLIQIRNIDENRRIKADEVLWITPETDVSKYLVRKGDVLFLSRGHRIYALVNDQDWDNAMVPNYFYILRPKKADLLPEFLAWTLSEGPGQEYLFSNAKQGSHIPYIQRKAFEAMKLEIPPLAIQKSVSELSFLSKKEQQLMTTLQEKRRTLINETCVRAIRHSDEGGN